jgi:anti-sigma B factor antagonist
MIEHQLLLQAFAGQPPGAHPRQSPDHATTAMGDLSHQGGTPGPQSPVSVSLADDSATVTVRGDFDMSATFRVEPTLEATLQEPGIRAITLDLSGLTFIDSTGLGVITKLDSEARGSGIALAIVPGPRDVQRVFEISGLSDTLPFR